MILPEIMRCYFETIYHEKTKQVCMFNPKGTGGGGGGGGLSLPPVRFLADNF